MLAVLNTIALCKHGLLAAIALYNCSLKSFPFVQYEVVMLFVLYLALVVFLTAYDDICVGPCVITCEYLPAVMKVFGFCP